MGSFDALVAVLRPWTYPVACWGAFVFIVVFSKKWRRKLAERAEALLWAAVFSVLVSFGFDLLNSFAPVWTHLGLPYGEPFRTAAEGLSYAAAVPTILAAAFLCLSGDVEPPDDSPRRSSFLAAFLLSIALACGAYLVRDRTFDGAMLLCLAAVWLAADGGNGRVRRPSILAWLRTGDVRPPFALVGAAAVWAATVYLASLAAPPGRAYIAFADPLWLLPVSMLEALALWACYVTLAAWTSRPLLLFAVPDKEEIKIFG